MQALESSNWKTVARFAFHRLTCSRDFDSSHLVSPWRGREHMGNSHMSYLSYMPDVSSHVLHVWHVFDFDWSKRPFWHVRCWWTRSPLCQPSGNFSTLPLWSALALGKMKKCYCLEGDLANNPLMDLLASVLSCELLASWHFGSCFENPKYKSLKYKSYYKNENTTIPHRSSSYFQAPRQLVLLLATDSSRRCAWHAKGHKSTPLGSTAESRTWGEKLVRLRSAQMRYGAKVAGAEGWQDFDKRQQRHEEKQETSNKMHKNASCERQAITTKYKNTSVFWHLFLAKHIRIYSPKSLVLRDKDYPSLAEVKAAFGSKDLHPSAFKPAAQGLRRLGHWFGPRRWT